MGGYVQARGARGLGGSQMQSFGYGEETLGSASVHPT